MIAAAWCVVVFAAVVSLVGVFVPLVFWLRKGSARNE